MSFQRCRAGRRETPLRNADSLSVAHGKTALLRAGGRTAGSSSLHELDDWFGHQWVVLTRDLAHSRDCQFLSSSLVGLPARDSCFRRLRPRLDLPAPLARRITTNPRIGGLAREARPDSNPLGAATPIWEDANEAHFRTSAPRFAFHGSPVDGPQGVWTMGRSLRDTQ